MQILEPPGTSERQHVKHTLKKGVHQGSKNEIQKENQALRKEYSTKH